MELISCDHITVLLAGMLIMSCLIASMVFLRPTTSHTTSLRWWTAALAAVLSIGFGLSAMITFPNDALAALNFHVVVIDMLLLPIGAIVMVLLVTPQRITRARVLYNIVPFIVACPLCMVINHTWYTYTIAIGMVGYIVAMMIYIMVMGTRYERELKEEYSSLHGRSTRWMICILVYMVLIVIDFGLFSIARSGWDRLIYYGLNAIVWSLVFLRIWQTVLSRENSHAKELDVDEIAREKEEEKANEPMQSEDTENFTKRLTELIEKEQIYSQDDLTRDDLARKIGMSHTTFSKLLRQTTGQNFYEYINGVRIDKATEMIKEGKMDIWSIGQTVGYRYRSTFYRAFAAIHGCTPAEYNQQTKQK